MKKLAVILCIILSILLVACSSVGEVRQKITDTGYESIDLTEVDDLSAMQQFIARTIINEGKYATIKTATENVKGAKISVFAKNPGMAFGSIDYAIVVEFNSKDALIAEFGRNDALVVIGREIVGNSGDIISLLEDTGTIYKNCFIYATGPNKASLYTALTTK